MSAQKWGPMYAGGAVAVNMVYPYLPVLLPVPPAFCPPHDPHSRFYYFHLIGDIRQLAQCHTASPGTFNPEEPHGADSKYTEGSYFMSLRSNE